MKNNIDQNNIDDFDNKGSLEGLSHDEIAKKFDDQMNTLRNIAKKEANEAKNSGDDNVDNIIDDFFEKEKEDLDKINTISEIRTKINYRRIANRPINIQKAIQSSGHSVLMEIKDWHKQKNPVSKSLFRIAHWILKSEKEDNIDNIINIGLDADK